MNRNRSYKTKQKELLVAFLRDHQGHHVTVELIRQHFREKGQTVGLTTLYRNLDKLVESGAVIKYVIPKGTGACYQYLEQPVNHSKYYYLMCIECGKIIPLPCGHLEALSIHIGDEYHFRLDSAKTILYGYCGSCHAAKESVENDRPAATGDESTW